LIRPPARNQNRLRRYPAPHWQGSPAPGKRRIIALVAVSRLLTSQGRTSRDASALMGAHPEALRHDSAFLPPLVTEWSDRAHVRVEPLGLKARSQPTSDGQSSKLPQIRSYRCPRINWIAKMSTSVTPRSTTKIPRLANAKLLCDSGQSFWSGGATA